MITQKVNLLQRVRVVMIALVAVIGFGTMAMKPDVRAAQTYGVAETTGGQDWRIVANVTGQAPGSDYDCNQDFSSTCTIRLDASLNNGDLVPKTTPVQSSQGRFEP